MIRITTLLWIALLVVAGGTVMRVSYQVRRVEKHLNEVDRATEREQMAIRVLSAEWDTLNDPRRIDALSKRYLALVPTPIQRVVTLDQIPLKRSPDDIARLLAAQNAKSVKGCPVAKPPLAPIPAKAKPEAPAVEVRATTRDLAPAADVALPSSSLVYARVERRE